MNFEEVMHQIGRLAGTLRFFPAEADARIGIAEEVAAMCSSIEQVEWTIRRLPKLFSEWPGMREVRAVVCSKFKPADGIQMFSESFPDGIPSEHQQKPALEAPRDPRSRELPPGPGGDAVRAVVAKGRHL